MFYENYSVTMLYKTETNILFQDNNTGQNQWNGIDRKPNNGALLFLRIGTNGI